MAGNFSKRILQTTLLDVVEYEKFSAKKLLTTSDNSSGTKQTRPRIQLRGRRQSFLNTMPKASV